MKLRLVVRNEASSKTVEVHGELVREALPEFDSLCRPRAGLIIDLSNVRRVDTAAAARLRELSVSGVALVGASPFISMLIELERG